MNGCTGDVAALLHQRSHCTMRRREDGDAEAIRAAHQFIARQPELQSVADTGTYRRLGELLDRIERQAAEQVSTSLAGQSATQAALSARHSLETDYMQLIDSIARYLEDDHPELRSLRMPARYLSAAALMAHASGMAAEASKWKDDFVSLGLPEDFPERMEAAIRRFKEASAEPRQHRAARRGATEGGQADLKQARKHLRVLDSFVQKDARDNPALLAEWESVKRYPARKKARVEAPSLMAPPAPLMLPATADPITVSGPVEGEKASVPAKWTLRGLFRT